MHMSLQNHEFNKHCGVQDTGAVLEDVRKIIAEQLGTDQDKVSC